MKIKNSRTFLLLFVCIFCIAYLYIKSPVNAQYPINNYNYYEYPTQTVASSYLYNTYNTMYSDNYTWFTNQNFGIKTDIPTPKINEWTVHPSFGNTVYAVNTEGNALTIYGTYFSAHTQAGVNFNRTLSMGSLLHSMPKQTMYQNIGGQSSFISPVSYYARQVLQFSPVLHGPLLNY